MTSTKHASLRTLQAVGCPAGGGGVVTQTHRNRIRVPWWISFVFPGKICITAEPDCKTWLHDMIACHYRHEIPACHECLNWLKRKNNCMTWLDEMTAWRHEMAVWLELMTWMCSFMAWHDRRHEPITSMLDPTAMYDRMPWWHAMTAWHDYMYACLHTLDDFIQWQLANHINSSRITRL